jgi:hypothetical protein
LRLCVFKPLLFVEAAKFDRLRILIVYVRLCGFHQRLKGI